MNYKRLSELNRKVKNGKATPEEQNELMAILFNNGSITQKQYQDYLNGKNPDDIVSAALVIAGIVLLGYLLAKAFD